MDSKSVILLLCMVHSNVSYIGSNNILGQIVRLHEFFHFHVIFFLNNERAPGFALIALFYVSFTGFRQ